jgi:hypothetical protein
VSGSWLEAVARLVNGFGRPRALIYGGFVAGWTILAAGLDTLASGRPSGWLASMLLVSSAIPAGFLWSMQVLDDVAIAALERLRPVLSIDDAAQAGLATSFRRTPPGWAALALVLGLAGGVGSVLGSPTGWGISPTDSPVRWAVILATSSLSTIVLFGYLAHVVHQMRLVDQVHRRAVVVDLFRLEPLYSFATLTARSGIVLIAIAMVGLLAVMTIMGTSLSLGPSDLLILAVLLGMAAASFVVPLLSLHERIVDEKDRRLAEANRSLALAIGEVHRRIGSGELDAAAGLHDAIDAANAAMASVSRVSTWPWRPETLRGFLSAVLLPVGLWLTFEVLGRILPP